MRKEQQQRKHTFKIFRNWLISCWISSKFIRCITNHHQRQHRNIKRFICSWFSVWNTKRSALSAQIDKLNIKPIYNKFCYVLRLFIILTYLSINTKQTDRWSHWFHHIIQQTYTYRMTNHYLIHAVINLIMWIV